MKRLLLLLAILSVVIGAHAFVSETASLENFLIRSETACAYDNWISHLAEGIAIANYNLYAPYDRQTDGFGDYVSPTTEQLTAWGNIVDLFLAGLLEEAQAAVTASNFPYQVVEFHDTDSGRTYYMLREIPNMDEIDDNGTPDPYDDEIGAFSYGWGLYIYNPEATRPIILTVPHPTDDFATPIMGYDALTIWDAAFLMINGAGREVKWTNQGTFTNTKSLSDPTRNENHVFNVSYKKFADLIRAETGKREFSFQVHSYDWNRHQGYTDNQISAGYNKLCPNLPIRDLSSLKLDLINRGDHLMIPANTIGTHADVYLNQYYSVNYSVHDFYFDDGENYYPVNDQVDLPAYSQNRQMVYTLNGWNDYDSFEPFFHIEMDELPNAYEETENNYKWFYGWNETARMWDFNNLFTRTRQYYGRWVNDLNSLYDDLFAMNDAMLPSPVQNLRVINTSMYYVTLGWDRTDSYDFDSYEILYSTSPINGDNFQVFDRGNSAFLASQACERINVTGLSNTANYYFKVRARDKNGNYSLLSNEVTTAPAPANISSFTTHGMGSLIRLYWTVSGQSGLQGYKIHRAGSNGTDLVISSYEDNPNLLVGSNSYEFFDYEALPGVDYIYTLGMVDGTGFEFIHNVPQNAALGQMRNLVFSTVSGSHSDTLVLGNNAYASDGQDAYWDVTKGNPSSNYVWIASWQQYWGSSGTQLSREVRAGYDLNADIKSWTLRVRSDRINIPLQIALDQVTRSEKMFLYDSGTWHDLSTGPYQFTVANSNIRTMTLYWGNLQPTANHSYIANRIYQGGEAINMYWSFQNSFLVDHFDLYIKNATDSLSILEHSPVTTTNYSYILPQSIDMPGAKIYIDVVAVDGIRSTYASAHTLAFVPKMNLFYCEPGWTTRTNPFVNLNLDVATLFGAGAEVFTLGEAWTPSPSFDHGVPYFVHATDYLFNSTTSAVLSGESSIVLNPGWNLVANPHLCAYNLSSLRFFVDSVLFRYSEMIDQELISRAVYVYRENSYQMVNAIQAQEAFFIYNYAPESIVVELNFFPYFAAPQINPPAPNWSIDVTASGADKDSFRFGASPIATNDFDFRVDMPKAPEKLLFPSITTYLYNPDNADVRLQEEFRMNFLNQDDEMLFNFSLIVPDSNPVTFSFNPVNIPQSWTPRFVLEGIPMTITEDAVYEFIPTESGTYNGYIRVSNHPVSNQDQVQSVITGLKVYPNPFNPVTNISFLNPVTQDLKVDIFNIRGQRVSSLHRGSLSAGMQTLTWQGLDDNGTPVSSGIYFARLKGKRSSQSIKMILMK